MANTELDQATALAVDALTRRLNLTGPDVVALAVRRLLADEGIAVPPPTTSA